MNSERAIRGLYARLARIEQHLGLEPRGPGRGGVASPNGERSEPRATPTRGPGPEAASGDGEGLAEPDQQKNRSSSGSRNGERLKEHSPKGAQKTHEA